MCRLHCKCDYWTRCASALSVVRGRFKRITSKNCVASCCLVSLLASTRRGISLIMDGCDNRMTSVGCTDMGSWPRHQFYRYGATVWAYCLLRTTKQWAFCDGFVTQSADSFGRLIPWLMFLYVYVGCEWTLLTCCWLPLMLPRVAYVQTLTTVAVMFGVCFCCL